MFLCVRSYGGLGSCWPRVYLPCIKRTTNCKQWLSPANTNTAFSTSRPWFDSYIMYMYLLVEPCFLSPLPAFRTVSSLPSVPTGMTRVVGETWPGLVARETNEELLRLNIHQACYWKGVGVHLLGVNPEICLLSLWTTFSPSLSCWACGRLSLPRPPVELVDDFLSLVLLLSLWTTFSPSSSCWACGRLSLPRPPVELVDDFLSLVLLLSLWTTFSPSSSCWACGRLSLPRSPVELVDDFLSLALLLSLWTTFSPSLSAKGGRGWGTEPPCPPPPPPSPPPAPAPSGTTKLSFI